MFSRSEKTEEAFDPSAPEPSGERSPMVLAALAGLLAIAGAFLLVWYLSNGDDGEVAQTDENGVALSQDGTTPVAVTEQVLVVSSTIPRGTPISDIAENPTAYLSAQAIPSDLVAPSAVSSVAELEQFEGLVLSSEALPGDQLLSARFRDPGDFDASNESFFESAIGFEAPENHHAFSIDVPAERALGGNIGRNDLLTIIGTFRLQPTGGGALGRDVSVIVVNAVEVLDVTPLQLAVGAPSDNVNEVSIGNVGTYRVTVALLPEELTDVAYTAQYGQILLATAVLENDDRVAVTTMRQLVGDDGEWLNELDDGNIVDLTELFPPEGSEAEGLSIDIEPSGSETGEDDSAEPSEEEPSDA